MTSRPIDKSNTRPDESNHRARNWMFTVNNWKKDDLRKLKVYAAEKCKYMVIGKEVGKTGVPHLQGYMQLDKQTAGQTVKNQSKCLRMWMGIANSAEKADKYCKKDGDFWTYGKINLDHQGKAGGAATKRTWEQLHHDVKSGMQFEDLQDKYPTMVYQTETAVRNSIARRAPKRNFKTCVHVYFGEAGTGKTHRAKLDAGENVFMHNPQMGHWFDGYNGSQNVIIDEMKKGQFQLGSLLSLMDEHPCTVQVKQGSVNFAPKTLVITSNHPPQEWYNPETLDPNSMTALWRRINVCKEFRKDNDAEWGSLHDYDTVHEMYRGGCICGGGPKLTKSGTLILEDSEFPHVTHEPLELPSPKRRKLDPRSKNSPLTQDPIVVASESDSDDESYPGDYGDLSSSDNGFDGSESIDSESF